MITVIFLFLLCGCVQTPQEDVVINKNDGVLHEVLLATPAPLQSIDAPDHWRDAYRGYGENLSVEIDAEVIVPAVSEIAVLSVAPSEWTDEQAARCIQAMIGTAPIYEQATELSKADIEELIKECQDELSNPASDLNTMLGKPGLEDEYNSAKAALQKEIELLGEQWKSAPATVERKLVEPRFSQIDDYSASIEGTALLPDGTSGFIRIVKRKGNFNQSMNLFVPHGELGAPSVYSGKTTGLQGIRIDLGLAAQTADDMLKQMGLYGQYVLSFSGSAWTHTPESIAGQENPPECYLLFYNKTHDGIPVLFGTNLSSSIERYEASWPYEMLCFGVNDTGVIFFEWISPLQAIDKMNTNVSILSFDKIMERFQQSIVVSYNPINTGENVDEYRLYINRIEFGYTRVAIPNKNAEAMLVPSWGFYGYELDYYKDAGSTQHILDENNCKRQDMPGHCFLTINAIDGSVIDRTLGY